jgi:hypothetical protein
MNQSLPYSYLYGNEPVYSKRFNSFFSGLIFFTLCCCTCCSVRYLFLITSHFRDMGRCTPWSFRLWLELMKVYYNPHALQSMFPSSSRLQRGVLSVLQFEQMRFASHSSFLEIAGLSVFGRFVLCIL